MNNSGPKNILISGWYGHGNTGDEALLRVFVREMQRRLDVHITVLSENPTGVQACNPDLNVGAVPHYPLLNMEGMERLVRGHHNPMLGTLRKADLFVLGGGSILRDNTSWRNFLRVADELFLARLMGVPAALYAVGVGPFRSERGKWLAARAARGCRLITVRDEQSKAHLTDKGVAPARVNVVTDPAFLLEATEPGPDFFPVEIRELMGEPGKLAFVYPAHLPEVSRSGLRRDDAMMQMARGIERLRDEKGLTFVFIPMHDHPKYSDVAVARELVSRMSTPADMHVLDRVLMPEEVKYLTRVPALNICVRLHAFIFAAAEGQKAIAFNYEPKVRNNARHFGVEDFVVDLDDGMDDDFKTRADRLLALDTPFLPDRRISELRAGATRTFDMMASLLTR